MNTEELSQQLSEALGPGYEVVSTLGAGGFAVVFLVRDLNLKRKLAVKVLSPDVITSKTVLERFKREAETVAQLSHPHIVPLHFIGQKDDLLYLAMACIEGGSLADRIEKEKRLPSGDVARYLVEIGSALDYAHKRGVIHRDIKPHNVLLEAETGRSLVTDFGIARTADGGSLTATGMLVGTPTYMSPEQVAGEGGDHRADIYALGIMAYEMLTGAPPFTGGTPTLVMMKRLAEPPPPLAKLRPDAPEELRDVIEGMLATDPAERFQSAGDVVRALSGHTPVTGSQYTAEFLVRRRAKTRRRGVLAGLAVVVIAGAAAAAIALRPRDEVVVASVDADMVVIAAGKYTVGSDQGPDIARPAHTVELAEFGIDVTEVTVGDYAAFAATGKPAPWTTKPDSLLPVTGVTFEEAKEYCGWRHPEGGRLPTEEEWEAAARGLGGRSFPWGEVWSRTVANTESARRAGPAPVRHFPAGTTPEGVHDLIGNVWEWTSTPVAPYPGGPPIPSLRGGEQYNVIRGGAFDTPDPTASPVHRGYISPSAGRADLAKTGFRCVMPVRVSGKP